MSGFDLPVIGSLGGSANEQGSAFRGLVGAVIASAILSDSSLASVGLSDVDVVPTYLVAEADGYVDDLVTGDEVGVRIFIQAKRSVGLGSSSMAEAMGQFAAAIQSGLGENDRLVLAVGRPTGELEGLIDVLDRERRYAAGSRTSAQSRSADKLTRLARRYLRDEQLAELFARLIIWHVPVGPYRFALAGRLEPSIAAAGWGPAAAEALISIVRSLAGLRAGDDAAALVDGLRRRDVPLADRSDATGPVARAQALVDHRARVRGRGERLELFGITGRLGELLLRDADCDVRVIEATDDRNDRDQLRVVMRRQGRILLIGSAGAGKSTALRALGAVAAKSRDWPTPVVAHVGRLLDTAGSLTDRLLQLAAESALPQDRPTLRDALSLELGAGRLLLILDGFDEMGSARWPGAARRLDEWIGSLPETVEVVLATRPVAGGVEAAGALGFNKYELQIPDHPHATVRTILEAVAGDRGGEWVDERSDWVSTAFRRDRVLRERPLLVVVLAVIASQAKDLDALPHSRATILRQSLHDVARRWEVERREGDLRMGDLGGTNAELVVEQCLATLCAAILTWEQPSEHTLLRRLAEQVSEDFGLRPGSARAAAMDALDFWVRAGVFAIHDGQVGAPIRPLAEIGLAEQWAAADVVEHAELIARGRADRSLGEVLRLAAGLSVEFARAWARAIAGDGSAVEIITLADASGEVAALDGEIVKALIDRFDEVVADAEEAERVGEALALLAASDDSRAWLRERVCSTVSPKRRLMMEALLIYMWDEHGSEADELLRAFVGSEWPVKRHEPSVNESVYVISDDSADPLYQHAHQQTVLRVAGLSRADAELAVEHYRPSSAVVGQQLQAILASAGNEDLAEQVREVWSIDWDLRSKDGPDVTAQVLEWLATLSEPRPLQFGETRKLQELADFFATAGCNWMRPTTLDRYRETVHGWVRAVAVLGDFDLPLLSAQARLFAAQLADDEDDESQSLIYRHGQVRKDMTWEVIEQVQPLLGDLVAAIGVVPRSARGTLLCAIFECPDHERAAEMVMQRLARLRIWAATLAAEIALFCLAATSEDRATAQALDWGSHEDPMVRSAAALWLSACVRIHPSDDEGWRRCLEDDDWDVRHNALEYLDGATLTDTQRELLRELPTAPPGVWLCSHCGETNPSTSACSDCHRSAPSLNGRVRELLEPNRATPSVDIAELFSQLPATLPHIRRAPDDSDWL